MSSSSINGTKSLLENKISEFWPVESRIEKKDATPWMIRNKAYESSRLYKEKVKKYHDKYHIKIKFKLRELVLLFNSRLKLFPGKLRSKWPGPFKIKEVKPYGAVELEDLVSKKYWAVNDYIEAIPKWWC